MSEVQVKQAATLLIARKRQGAYENNLVEIDVKSYDLNESALDSLPSIGEDIASSSTTWEIFNNFELLWGQSEVVNWMRSTDEKDIKLMSYPGEFKLPGGAKDKKETLLQTAIRETAEEFLITIPDTAKIHPLHRVTTKVINNKQFVMHNFIAFDTENPWISKIDVNAINSKLADRQKKFESLKLNDGNFWENWKKISYAEREALSPEVHEVRWFSMFESMDLCLSSKSNSFRPVNDYQREQFAKYGRKMRDPMFATLIVLVTMAQHKSVENILEFCETVSFEEPAKL